ncbi:MAG: restriction endonuclease subunit S [Allorhizobium sp.]
MELRSGYKKTEIGVIPEDWDVTKLGEVAQLYQPVTISAAVLSKDGYPVYGANGVVGYYSKTNHDSWQTTVTCRGSTCGTVNRTVDRCWITGNAMVANIDRNPKIDKEFFYFLMLFQDFVDCITGTGQPQIVRGPLADFRLAVPRKLSEQKAIAEALSDVDASIAALSRLIAKKRDLRQGAMQRLLTGQTRLPGFTASWQEKRLGDHVAFLKNGIQSRAQLTLSDPVRYLHYGDIHVTPDLYLDLSNTDMPRLPSPAAAGLTRLQDGDIVFVDASEDLNGVGKSLEIVGAIGVEAVSGQHTIAGRFDKSVLADGFKRYLQFIPAFTVHLRRLAAGTKVYATNRKHIASAELQLPETDEQIAIARVLSDMELEISALEARLDKARALKQAMMQALLTGRVRLPVRRDAAPQPKEAAHA